MNRGNARIGMVTGACLVLLLLVFFSLRNMDLEEDVLGQFVFSCEQEGQTIEFPIWKDKTVDKYYLFLPSWFSGKTGEFNIHYNDHLAKVKIDGTFYPDGSLFRDSGTEDEHSFEVSGIGGAVPIETTLQILRSEKLPSIFISVKEQERILDVNREADKRHFETGFMSMMDQDGKFLCQGELDKFKVRGNLTATLEKSLLPLR